MTEPADDIIAGREAWSRLRDCRAGFDDWLVVARAVRIGRAEAMAAAKTNAPVGTRYNRCMGAWLAERGLDGISTQERYRALLVLENLPAISAWRATLPPDVLRRLNHPNAIWQHFIKPGKVAHKLEPRPRPEAPFVAKGATGRRPIFWPQEALRRAHRAMLDARSNDLLKLARCALEAAIRDEGDLLALLDDNTPPPRRPAPALPPPEYAAA